MAVASPGPADPVEVETRRATRRARWFYASLPIGAMLALLGAGIPLSLLGGVPYREIVPLLLVLGAIVVLFVGAWYDFGAKQHVREVLEARLPFTEADLAHIYRQQFLLTVCYAGVAGLYVLVAVAITVG